VNKLNAGDKYHLAAYHFRKVDGKVKARRAKVVFNGEAFDSEDIMCRADHVGVDLQHFISVKRDYPERVCKHCLNRLQAAIEKA